MKKYLTFFKLRFITELQYRAAVIAGVLTQIFFGLVFIFVYKAFYASGNEGPMTFPQLVTYLWLQQAFYALIYIFHREKDIVQMIKNGNISYELTRPCNLVLMWFSKIYGAKISSVMLRFLPIIILGLILPEPYNLLIVPIDQFLGFILTLFFGSILICVIITLFHLLIFYTIDSDGILNSFKIISEFFSGAVIPIPFLPKIMQKIAAYLPFEYINDIPMRIYVGNISVSKVLPTVLMQIMWIVILTVFSLLLTKRILKKIVVQGG